jgi:hypothetical protein
MKNLTLFMVVMFILSSNLNAQLTSKKGDKIAKEIASCKYCSKKFSWSTKEEGQFSYQGYVIPERGSCAEQIDSYASNVQFALKNEIPGGKLLLNCLIYGKKYCSKKCAIEDGTCINKGVFE